MKGMITTILYTMAVAAMVAGCATGGGVDNEALIRQTLGGWTEGVTGGDIEKVMAAYSENFDHYEYGKKASLKQFLGGLMDQGQFDNAEVSLDDAEITIEGDTAKVYPVDLEASFGGATLELTLKREDDGVWRITTMEVEMF